MGEIKHEERFVQLGWQILEMKMAYYLPHMVHSDWVKEYTVSDQTYDTLESEYRSLAHKLNLPPSACEHVGFPSDAPCGKLVASKLSNSRKSITKQ
jgi:hypothetical protein